MRPHRFANPLIAGYIAVQLLAPISGFFKDKFDSWGRFTWNMYAETYRCRNEYQVVDERGLARPLYVDGYLARGDNSVAKAAHRDVLPVLHKFLCEQLARSGTGGRLRGECVCTSNGAEFQTLIDDKADLCSAPNYGVALR
ncbi:MAG: HTTM domain-containing protein [Gemmatimonadota bacterium]